MIGANFRKGCVCWIARIYAIQTLSLAEVGVEAELICLSSHDITGAHLQKLHSAPFVFSLRQHFTFQN